MSTMLVTVIVVKGRRRWAPSNKQRGKPYTELIPREAKNDGETSNRIERDDSGNDTWDDEYGRRKVRGKQCLGSSECACNIVGALLRQTNESRR